MKTAGVIISSQHEEVRRAPRNDMKAKRGIKGPKTEREREKGGMEKRVGEKKRGQDIRGAAKSQRQRREEWGVGRGGGAGGEGG